MALLDSLLKLYCETANLTIKSRLSMIRSFDDRGQIRSPGAISYRLSGVFFAGCLSASQKDENWWAIESFTIRIHLSCLDRPPILVVRSIQDAHHFLCVRAAISALLFEIQSCVIRRTAVEFKVEAIIGQRHKSRHLGSVAAFEDQNCSIN